jgi:hypothetical protein
VLHLQFARVAAGKNFVQFPGLNGSKTPNVDNTGLCGDAGRSEAT